MTLLWEWDPDEGTDQFDGSPAFESGLSAGALSVENDAALPRGKKLRMSASGTGAGISIILIADLIIQVDKDLLFEIELAGQSSQYGGIALLGGEDTSGDFHSINYLFQGWRSRVDAASLVFDGSTNNSLVAVGRRGQIAIRQWMDQPAAARPRFTHHCRSTYDNATPGSGGGGALFAMSDEDYATIDSTAFPSSWWDSVPCNRVGLCLQASGGASPGNLDISRLRIFDDPLADGGSVDVDPPTVTYELSSSSQLLHTGAIPVTVTDALGLAMVIVGARYPTNDPTQDRGFDVAWDGTQFSSDYASSTREEIEDGYRFVLRKRGGWPTLWRVTPYVWAVNTAGVVATS